MVLNPMGYVSRQVGGVGGIFLDPLATAGEKIGGPVGGIIDPARGLDKMMKPNNPAQPDRSPVKSPEDISREARDRILKSQDAERRKKSVLMQLNDSAGDISGGAGAAGRPTGTQKLDSILTAGKKTILGT
jgi:hypothetical protein